MGKKYVVRLTEQELADLISSNLMSDDGTSILGDYLNRLFGKKDKPESDKTISDKPESDKFSTDSPIVKGGDSNFVTLNLNTPDGYKAYQDIANRFISSRSSNLLGITGAMLADAAKNAFNKHGKYVPPELALAQLATEGGLSDNPKARPIRTKNPFNVGNVDTGKNISHSSVQSGIQSYYDLIARNYLSGSKTASDLLNNFVNASGQRYATERSYENLVKQIANSVKQKSEPIYASLLKKSDSKSV